MEEKEANILERIDTLALEITKTRQKPLLVLYYPEDGGFISPVDVSDVYDELRRGTKSTKINDMDILLHTYGGVPHPAYRMIQLVRSFTNNVSMLVPFHAYSAGTLMCLGTDRICLGAYAALSPIDIHIPLESGNIELIAVDKYIEFVEQCKTVLEKSAQFSTNVAEVLLVELVQQVGAINIGTFFRNREITKYYAEVLLFDYMLNGVPDKEEKIKHIVDMMVFKFPSHEFEIDYNILKKIGLPVEEMMIDLSDKTKSLVKLLEEAMKNDRICRYTGDEYRLPFFRFYNIEEENEQKEP